MTSSSLPDDSWASSAAARAVMQANRGRDTAPELAVRRRLHRDGYRYRVQFPVPGVPRRRIDIAFPRQRIAVEIRGCFWHGCELHASWPKSNSEWWRRKILGNRARDAGTEGLLREAGWLVIVAWEHDDPDAVALEVEATVERRRGATDAVVRP